MKYYIGSTVLRDGPHPFRVEVRADKNGAVEVMLQRISCTPAQLQYGGYTEGEEIVRWTADVNPEVR